MEFLVWFFAVLLSIAAMGLILSKDWRWSMAFLGLHYAGTFALMLTHWNFTMAGARLLTGLMATILLALTLMDKPQESLTLDTDNLPGGRLFRIFAGGLVLLSVSQASAVINGWLPDASQPVLAGALSLLGLGLLHLGITTNPLRVILGLLTTLSGFEIIFSVVENSVLVTALLSVVTMMLALVGSYLINQAQPEELAQ